MTPNPQRQALADTVKRLRAHRGMTQKELAERSGLGVRTIGGIETGEKEPLRPTLLALAQGLGMTPQDLEAYIGAYLDFNSTTSHLTASLPSGDRKLPRDS